MGLLRPLRTPPFARLLTSYFVNELGDTLGAIALAILVYAKTGDPLATTALLVASRFVPSLLAPALTARVDQLAVGPTLAVLYVIEAACFAALALLTSNFSLPLVLILGLIDGLLALTARALTRGAIAATFGTGESLRAANALVNVAFSTATILGAILAGILVASFDVRLALLLDAASFALVSGLVLTCRGLPGAAELRVNSWERLREALGFVRRQPLLRLLLAAQAVALVLFTLIVPIEVVYAEETLDAGSIGFGVLMASWGGGMVIGSAVFVAARRLPTLTLVWVATALVGAGYLGMGLVRDLVPAATFSVVGGIGNGMQVVAVVTLLQQHTPLGLQARVTGLLESLSAAMPGVGYLLGGALTAAAGPATTYLAAGAGLLGLVLTAWVVFMLTGARRAALLAAPQESDAREG